MNEDPIVAEIHRIREEYANRFNNDMDAIGRDLREQQSRSGLKYIRLRPKQPSPMYLLNPASAASTSISTEPR